MKFLQLPRVNALWLPWSRSLELPGRLSWIQTLSEQLGTVHSPAHMSAMNESKRAQEDENAMHLDTATEFVGIYKEAAASHRAQQVWNDLGSSQTRSHFRELSESNGLGVMILH